MQDEANITAAHLPDVSQVSLDRLDASESSRLDEALLRLLSPEADDHEIIAGFSSTT
jgi:FXSXX-COOH protein